jgi:putative transposase
MLKLVHDGSDSNANGVAALGSSLLDEIVRDGARQMLARLVVRNGYHAEREVITAAGAVKVRQLRQRQARR